MSKQKRVLKTETLQKKTNKRFPDCRVVQDEYGLWYIMDMHGQNTFEEFFIPHQKTEREAWEMGQLTASTIQNFNRTHPLKVDMQVESDERKASRITRRKTRKK